MLQFVCDYCGNVKQPGETWINGVAVENVGTRAARREVILDPVWRYERSVLPLGVHFCCLDCKDSYLSELFQQPVALLEIQSAKRDSTGSQRVIRAQKKSITGTIQKRTTRSKRTRVQ